GRAPLNIHRGGCRFKSGPAYQTYHYADTLPIALRSQSSGQRGKDSCLPRVEASGTHACGARGLFCQERGGGGRGAGTGADECIGICGAVSSDGGAGAGGGQIRNRPMSHAFVLPECPDEGIRGEPSAAGGDGGVFDGDGAVRAGRRPAATRHDGRGFGEVVWIRPDTAVGVGVRDGGAAAAEPRSRVCAASQDDHGGDGVRGGAAAEYRAGRDGAVFGKRSGLRYLRPEADPAATRTGWPAVPGIPGGDGVSPQHRRRLLVQPGGVPGTAAPGSRTGVFDRGSRSSAAGTAVGRAGGCERRGDGSRRPPISGEFAGGGGSAGDRSRGAE